jgi:hypothetical protein
MFTALQQKNTTLKLLKIHIGMRRSFRGRIAGLAQRKPPETRTQRRSCLGFCNF